MRETLSFTTDTATLAIFDLHAIAHRKSDTADWWSVPDDELDEVNKGNIAFLGLINDGVYVVNLVDDVDDPDITVCINCPSGNIFIGAGEDTTGGDLEPDSSDYISGKIMIIPIGYYKVSIKRHLNNLLISLKDSDVYKNYLNETIKLY